MSFSISSVAIHIPYFEFTRTNIQIKSQTINDNLEAMARQLYDYWFVQFDFPNEKGKPYKSNGGKMVWNEKLKRNIPNNWNNGILSNIANITMGQSPDGSSYNENGNGTIFYQGSTDFGIRFPSIRKYTTAPSRFAKKGDILMSVRAPVGAMNIANNDCCTNFRCGVKAKARASTAG
jgi:type I restriction enzyme S subunit